MVDWIKEHKVSIIASIIVCIFLAYIYFDGFTKEKEVTIEQDWMNKELNEEEKNENNIENQKPVIIIADIKGAVATPGVYEMAEGDRVIDLIEKAGGVRKDADTAAINFALRVSDEMTVYIPKEGEETAVVDGVAKPNGGLNDAFGESKVNVNLAEGSELEALPGIGPSKAKAIIEYREVNGPFTSIEDVRKVSGIGEKIFEKLKDFISVK